jgi:hypothetical protein
MAKDDSFSTENCREERLQTTSSYLTLIFFYKYSSALNSKENLQGRVQILEHTQRTRVGQLPMPTVTENPRENMNYEQVCFPLCEHQEHRPSDTSILAKSKRAQTRCHRRSTETPDTCLPFSCVSLRGLLQQHQSLLESLAVRSNGSRPSSGLQRTGAA